MAVILAAATTLAPAAAGKADLDVVVTIKPIHSLVTQLLDGVATPRLLVEGAATPHSFALKPSAVRALHGADVFVRVSESLEPFTGKLVRALPESVDVVTVADVAGLHLLDRRMSGTFDEEGEAHHDDEHAHSEDKDGHVWLDASNAKRIVKHLAQVLSQHAPAAADRIEANAAGLSARIDALDAELQAATQPLAGRPFIVFHDALHYYEDRYGLDAVGSITVSPEVQPSAKRLTDLRSKIRELGAVCVFSEPMFQPRLVAAVTEGTEARSGTLDPLGAMLPSGGEHYFQLMRNLAAALKACLDPST